MAAPVRTNLPPKGPVSKGPSGKNPPEKGPLGKGPLGKRPGGKRPVDPEDVPPPAPPPNNHARYLKLALIGTAVLSVLMVAGVGLYIGFSGEPALPPLTVDDVSPPTPAPRPAAIGPVRQGDLNDELWRRMGVRPDTE